MKEILGYQVGFMFIGVVLSGIACVALLYFGNQDWGSWSILIIHVVFGIMYRPKRARVSGQVKL